jgi:hypothetical protein
VVYVRRGGRPSVEQDGRASNEGVEDFNRECAARDKLSMRFIPKLSV